MAGTRDAGRSRALGRDSAKVLPALAAMPKGERHKGEAGGGWQREPGKREI